MTKDLKPPVNNPARAKALEGAVTQAGTLRPLECWPDLALIGCWLGGSVGTQASRLKEFYGDVPIRDLGYLASEGHFTIPHEDHTASGIASLHTNYFEFIPEEAAYDPDPPVLSCHELEQGGCYAVLLTTAGGLYRYDIHDIVQVTGFYRRAPLLAFIRKGRDMTSITGEKMHVNHLLLFLEQILNGIQFGVFLFLVSAGLTLVLGIMNVVNLAHGSLYMLGAYISATFLTWTDNFLLAIVLMVPVILIIGILIELIVLRTMYDRDHMDQVLATFGLILFFNQGVIIVWGPDSQGMNIPAFLEGSIDIIPGVPYPIFRVAIIGAGLAMATFLFLLITRTKIGMLIRAGASNGQMVRALGVNIRLLFTVVFGLGAILAGFAGLMSGPISSVESGMGEDMLILAFVVIVIGGIGSIRGAVIASVLIGIVEMVGRSILPFLMKEYISEDAAQTAGPAVASMLMYILMALVLFLKPQGLFPAKTG